MCEEAFAGKTHGSGEVGQGRAGGKRVADQAKSYRGRLEREVARVPHLSCPAQRRGGGG